MRKAGQGLAADKRVEYNPKECQSYYRGRPLRQCATKDKTLRVISA